MDERLIHSHLPAKETEVHFLSSHTFGTTQLDTIKKMHGSCKIIYNSNRFSPNRYETYEIFRDVILKLVHQQKIVGIYIVIKNEWREKFINDYPMKGRVNGALIGWFVGFGNSDYHKKTTQSLPYIWQGCMMKFKIEETFGRVPIVRSHYQKRDSSIESKKTRPVKTEQHRK